MGPRDQRAAERRDDVLVFSGPPLQEDLEVTGPIQARIWAASTASDTDFAARLVDVAPGGFATNLSEGIIRARYRESFEKPRLMVPGTAYEFGLEMGATSNVFKRGHRIRLEISTSNFPHYDRNPNTGHDFGMDAELVTAAQTVFHDAGRPSHIILPVIPAAPRRSSQP
jgi:putative CocE/NonD family hydrolase